MEAEPTTRVFCTLFDVHYLTRAVALYRSLEATHRSFRLKMFCMDDAAARLLALLQLPFAEPISISRLERSDPELASVRGSRNRVEYCWTATPSVCLYCLEQDPTVTEITYLDADLMFFSSSDPLFAELGSASVLITPHRFAPEWEDWATDGGIYNVQFMTFRATPEGLAALKWWRARCLEWCFDRFEPGRFGDQQYLDDWPTRFRGVHVLRHLGGGLAPWNSANYTTVLGAGGLQVNGETLIFYHHHGLEIYLDSWSRFWCGLATLLARLGLRSSSYRLLRGALPLGWRTYPPYRASGSGANPVIHDVVWTQYCRVLRNIYREIRRFDPSFTAGSTRISLGELLFWLLRDLLPRRCRAILGVLRRSLGIRTSSESS